MIFTQRVAAAAMADNKVSYTFNGATRLTHVGVTVVSSASVGSRQIVLTLRDAAGNALFTMAAGTTQAASKTYEYNYLREASARETTAVADSLIAPLGDVLVPAGGALEVADTAAIDAADTAALVMSWEL